jgi:NADH-quinone oxidoreductase subunit M
MQDTSLTLLLTIPTVSIFLMIIISEVRLIKYISLASSLLVTLLSASLLYRFDISSTGYQFVHWFPKFISTPSFSFDYKLGLDGFGALLLFMSVFMFMIAIFNSFDRTKERIKEFHIFSQLLILSIVGIFASCDIVLFYISWELMMIPLALLVGVWGGENRIDAIKKYIYYSMAGSLILLFAILLLYRNLNSTSIEILSLSSLSKLDPSTKNLLFWMFAFGFGLKVPLFPLHTWMPGIHEEAPTNGSVDLNAVVLKIGAFGFIRFIIPFFPEQSIQFQGIFLILSVFTILYGSWIAYVQTDIKKILAYSSLSHLGLVVLGIFSFTEQGVKGAMLQMINHGFSTGLLFLMVGMIYERTQRRDLQSLGGLAKSIPIFSLFFAIAVFSSAAVPGTNGFVGEFLIFMGAIQNNWLLGIIAGSSVVWTAAYLLRMMKSVLFGPTGSGLENIPDLGKRDWVVVSSISIFIFWIGLYPKPFLNILEPSVRVYTHFLSKSMVDSKNGMYTDLSGSRIETPFQSFQDLNFPPLSYEERLEGFNTPYSLMPIHPKKPPISEETEVQP